MRELDLPDASGYRPQEDFLIAAKAFEDSWAGNRLTDLWNLEEDEGEAAVSEKYPLKKLIARFWLLYKL